jgi:hypothetical protein
MGAVRPYPAALPAHDYGLVLTESGDIGGNERSSGTWQCALLCCLDPPRQDQRVIGKIRKLAEDLRLVDRAVDAPI